ncbi:zinc finger protein 592 [Phyllostomus hastatus]|uniref:zinc finger protein 592 n=1 Tax=Phyllostomus hastatus TaxID=9423 RepID=UPI001E67F685|nr:zinc finger protein 592 [Phyllostomus hastatus]XP_045680746.1 zinc finger protein 592 [Phyllostomus hastatus]
MGDMKTPDFDDLLAAFDIPDPTSLDAKEAIQTPSEDNENPLKPPGLCMEESVSLSHAGSASDVPAVSVIVKNTSRQESFEAEKDHLAPSLLHNGFRGADLPPDAHGLGHNCGKFDSAFMNGDSARSFPGKLEPCKSEPLPTFNEFSPISSPEPEDGIKDNGFGLKPKHADSYFPPPPPGCGPVAGPVLEALGKFPVPELHMFDHFGKKEPKPEPLPLGGQQEQERAAQKAGEPHKELDAGRFFGEALDFNSHPGNSVVEPKGLAAELGSCSSVPPRQRLKPAHSKLSSCVAALVALQAKRVASVAREDQPPGHTKDPSGPTREGSKGSPKMPKSPKSPRSPLEATRKSAKPSDSPRSICSDSSSRGSPSVAASSPPAIPKVRIKTIKTSSGQIKRTVTRILPDPDDPSKSPVGSPLGSAAAEAPSEAPEEEASALPAAEHSPEGAARAGSPQGDRKGAESAPKASEPASPGGSSASRVPAAAAAAAPGSQAGKKPQQSAGLPAAAPASANLLPKAVHLANLNLVPHSVAASVTAKSSAQRRSQPQPTQMSVPLVHQVKKAAPLVVEVFNKVLHSSNPVPLYAPNLSPPADSRIHVPASGYCCLECGDAFALEKSLSQHYGRRSVHIEVLCTLCSQTLVFFNKCSLLRHARDHKSKGLVMQCSQLLVKPISADQMFAAAAPANSSSAAAAAAAPAVPAPAPAPPPSPKHGPTIPALPLYPDPVRLIRHGVKCLECHKQIRDHTVMAAHFQRMSEETEGLTCPVCQMLLPNQCSFCAHQRTHTHKSPYCCPECGALCRSAYFQTHVKENCLHYARKVGYRCIHCGVVHLTLALLKSHIQEKHCQVFHKCAFCPMAFKTASSTADHSATEHPTQPPKPSQLMYKCSCEMVFHKKRQIQQHFYQDASKAQVGVFKCPECPLLFLQKPELMQHVKSVHGVPRNVEELSSLQSSADTASSGRPGSRVPTEPPPTGVAARGSSLPSGRWGRSEAHRRAEGKPRLRSTGWTCQECQEWVPDRESYVSHMKKSHGRALKRYPCRQCEQSFHTPSSLRKHIRNNHDTVRKVYTCGYCTEDSPSFPRPSLLESHISLMHGIRNPDLSQTSSIRPPGGHSPQVNHLKRRVSGAADAPGTSNGVTVSSVKRHKSLFQCAKCSFATDSGLEFQSHIPQHQTDSSTAQCPLCALCYTSAGSLGRHLFIVHKVREQEDDEEEAAEEAEPEEGSGEEVSMDARENGLEECTGELSSGDPEARRSPGPAPEEDGAREAQSQPQASRDQDSHAPSPQA